MEKERQLKVLAIVALVLAVTAMTLGYAAFSTTLNISSSASVTPTSDDFKIKIYGFKDYDSFINFAQNGKIEESFLSPTTTFTLIDSTTTSSSPIIDNSTHTISNIKINMQYSGTQAVLYFLVRNEGNYDAYIDLADFTCDGAICSKSIPIRTCTPGDGATTSLVEAACQDLMNSFGIINTDNIEEVEKIEKGKYIILSMMIEYLYPGSLADGPFEVSYEDIKLNFSTAK